MVFAFKLQEGCFGGPIRPQPGTETYSSPQGPHWAPGNLMPPWLAASVPRGARSPSHVLSTNLYTPGLLKASEQELHSLPKHLLSPTSGCPRMNRTQRTPPPPGAQSLVNSCQRHEQGDMNTGWGQGCILQTCAVQQDSHTWLLSM